MPESADEARRSEGDNVAHGSMGKALVLATAAMLIWSGAAIAAIPRTPYQRHGIVNCALPGTTIEFVPNGDGMPRSRGSRADIHRSMMRFRIARTWRAVLADGVTLSLDNGHNTRTMIEMPDGTGRGLAYVADTHGRNVGVSDIICQVLVTP